jgi:hypothetical protein
MLDCFVFCFLGVKTGGKNNFYISFKTRYWLVSRVPGRAEAESCPQWRRLVELPEKND